MASKTVHPSSGVDDTTDYVYDTDGNVVCSTSPKATAASVSCPSPGGSRVADTTTYDYNGDNQETSVTDPDANTTSYSYDGDGNQTQITDPLSNVTKTVYDADDRSTSVTEGDGSAAASTTSQAYDIMPTSGGPCLSSVTGATYCTSSTDGNGATRIDYYNSLNDKIEETQPASGTTTDTYDAAGNLETQTTTGGVATYGYDPDNRVTSIDYSSPASGYSAAHDVTYSYDADGQRTQMTDGTGTTSYSYDSLERLDSTTTGASKTTGYGYNLDNNVTTITYPNSDVVTYSYNDADAVSSVADGLGHTTDYTYDADGNETAEALPNGDTSSQSFNNDDQLTNISDAPTSSPSSTFATLGSTRNADGQVGSETDTGVPSPTSQSYSYDQVSRLTSSTSGSYGYDPAGNPTQLANGTDQTFNPAEQLTSGSTPGTTPPPAISSLSSSTTATSATVTWTTDEAASSYVEAGPTSGSYPIVVGSSTLVTSHSVTLPSLVCGSTYHYVVVSAIGAAATSSSDATFATSACSSGGGITVVGHATASDGGGDNSLSVTLPAGIAANDQLVVSVTTAYSTDPSTPTGWTKVTTASGESYEPKVTVFAKTADGTETTFTTDLGGYVGAEASAVVYRGVNPTSPIDATATATEDYSSVDVGPITASVPGEMMVLAEGATCNSSAESWTAPSGYTQETNDTDDAYDGSGIADATLPTNGTSGTVTATFGASAFLTAALIGLVPTSATTTTYSYDTYGDRTGVTATGSTTTLAYDQLGRLVSYGSNATYAYNGDGIRMSKTVSSTTTQETWNVLAAQEPELLVDGSTYYVYGPDGLPLEQINGSTVLYYLHDQGGSTRVLTNSSGTAVDTYSYDPYGELVASTGSDTNPLGFAGEYTDSESGYLYLENRYYDPATAELSSVDLAVDLTQSAYAYAEDDPVNISDPIGLFPSLSDLNPVHDVEAVGNAVDSAASAVGSAVGDHWRGILQGTEIGVGALAAAGCIAATAGVCGTVVGTVLAVGGIGGVTGVGFYGASSGSHTLSGYAQAFGLGTLGGVLSAGCALSAGTFCATVTGGFIFNSLVGAGIGAYGYIQDVCSPSALGFTEALLWGAVQNEPFPVPDTWLP